MARRASVDAHVDRRQTRGRRRERPRRHQCARHPRRHTRRNLEDSGTFSAETPRRRARGKMDRSRGGWLGRLRDSEVRVKKLGYGLLFAIALPLLLIVWSRRLDTLLALPVVASMGIG